MFKILNQLMGQIKNFETYLLLILLFFIFKNTSFLILTIAYLKREEKMF